MSSTQSAPWTQGDHTVKTLKMDENLQEVIEQYIANADTTLILNYMTLVEIPHALLRLDMVKRLYMKQNLLKTLVSMSCLGNELCSLEESWSYYGSIGILHIIVG